METIGGPCMMAAPVDDPLKSDSRSDQELIAAINDGDSNAFEVLYYRYRDWVVSLAYRFTGDRELALDVLQETFLYFVKKFPGFRLTAQLRTLQKERIFVPPTVDHSVLRISHPALTDLRVDWSGMHVTEVFPGRMPDVFVARPVILTGRFNGDGNTTVRIVGNATGRPVELTIPAKLDDPAATHRGLRSVWARMKIAGLGDEAAYENSEDLAGQIQQVALDYGLMSAFTAFVAVDSTRRTEGKEGTIVPIAVPVPESVKYETTVKGEK